MSAFLVDDDLIDFVLTFMMRCDAQPAKVFDPTARQWIPCDTQTADRITRRTNCDHIGQKLIDANYASLTARYGDNTAPHTYSFREHTARPKGGQWRNEAVQVFKALGCYDYQACEVSDYEQTDAAKIIQYIRCEAIRALPGYDEGAWGAPVNPARGARWAA